MKNLTFFLLLTIGVTSAQITPFAKVSIDPMMAIQGPHKGDDRFAEHSLDVEVQAGVEVDKSLRISMMYQIHNEINYSKWTLLAVDYMLDDFPLKNINCYAGAEISTIYRWFDNTTPTDPNNYLEMEATRMRYGLNAEIQWMPFKHFGVSSNINYFMSEQELRQYDDNSRWEVFVGFVYKFNEITW